MPSNPAFVKVVRGGVKAGLHPHDSPAPSPGATSIYLLFIIVLIDSKRMKTMVKQGLRRMPAIANRRLPGGRVPDRGVGAERGARWADRETFIPSGFAARAQGVGGVTCPVFSDHV